MTIGKNTYQEIMSQGYTWKLTLEALESTPSRLIEWLKQPWEEVIFVGCGSTYYLSLSAAVIWQSITGTLSLGMPASELWQFPESLMREQPTLLVAVSRSGETSETLRAIETFSKRKGSDFISISCYKDSETVARAPFALVARGAEENSIAQTRSFTSMLLITQYAAGIVAKNTRYINEIQSLPGLIDRLLPSYEPLAIKLGQDLRLDHFVFLGSGSNYGLACEAMLKMKEMSLSVSEAFHFLEFRHGPKSMVTPNSLIIGMINDGSRDHEIKVLEEMKDLGATVLAIDETGDGIKADHVIEVRSGLSTLARGSLLLPFLQLLAYYRSMKKDLNPDRPKNLEAVVKL